MKRCSSSVVRDFSVLLLKSLDSPVAHEAASHLEKGDDAAYLALSLDLSKYSCPERFFCDYIAVNLLSKFDKLRVDVDREKVALEKFLASEQKCLETNKRWSLFNRGALPFASRLWDVFALTRGKIERLLGPFDWDECWRFMNFGPGASTDVPRKKGDAFYKFGLLRPSTTGLNAIAADVCLQMSPRWRSLASGPDSGNCLPLTIVDGNRVTTVPKNAKTDRVIAIEPTMNMFVQKGLGGVIRRRLKRVGVNLDSQERNQRLALKGSVDGSLATLDLSAASDCIALRVVEDLVPQDWFSAMKLCRSPLGSLPDGSKIRYQKVSSMGNGFTFELESLIFWAICSACIQVSGGSDRDLAVYGDDLVVPTGSVELVTEALNFAGFSLNEEKSFSAGPFRESCGKHYYSGRDVTPLYIRKDVVGVERLLWLANSVKRLAFRLRGLDYSCDSRLEGAYRLITGLLPRRFQRPAIPDGLGDGALIGDLDEVCPTIDRNTGQWRVRFTARVFSQRRVGEYPTLLKALWGLERRTPSEVEFQVRRLPDVASGGNSSEIPLARFKLVLVKALVRQWGDLGPWL